MILEHKPGIYEIICDNCKKPMFECKEIKWCMSEYDQKSMYFPVRCVGCLKYRGRRIE